MVRVFRQFKREQWGLALIEGLIVFPLFILMISVFVEFGYGVYQWNQTARAVTHGARLAAVSSPVVLATDYLELGNYADSSALGTRLIGSPVVKKSCKGNTCIEAGFDRIYFGVSKGGKKECAINAEAVIFGICDFNKQIARNAVKITYTRADLGYVGRRLGPVVSVTVELENLYFDFFWVDALLGIDSIRVPTSPSTFVGEDLSNCRDPITKTGTTFANPC